VNARAQCEFCGQPVDPAALGTFQRTCGWTENRSAGGSNAIALPERTARYACHECIRLQRDGINPAQGSLL